MGGRGRLTVCATVATVAASCALLPLVEPTTWFLQAVALVAVQTGVGVAARLVPLARPLTVAAQALVSLVMLTALFARDVAPVSVVPTPAAVAHLGELLEAGVQDVGHYAAPAPATDGIRLMLVGGVLLIGLLVDIVAVTLRSAAPAGLPLLALYSVAAGLAQGDARWLWFLVAAAGYLLLLLAESRERLARWGHVFSERRRSPTTPFRSKVTPEPTVAPVRTGRRIGVLTLGVALLVPAALPSLDGGLLDAARTGGGKEGGDGSTVSAVNPLVALQDSLNQPDNRTALTYTSTADTTDDMYLRIVALDQFDGSAWKPSERRIRELPDTLPQAPGLSPEVRTERVRSSIKAADWYAQNWLPMPYPASRVDISGDWRFEPEGRTLVGDRGQTTRGASYQVDSLQVKPTAAQLREAPEPPDAMKDEYTEVPDSLPGSVHKTALRQTRGASNDYERAVRLQDWFAHKGGFTYDTQVDAGTGSAAIVNFLEQKEGFCIHFAFSMAAMARTMDIPARVAVGFAPGTPDGDTVKVGLQDAHAWPELYFEGVGWTRFEPTPSRGSTPSYAQPDLPDPNESSPEQQPEPPESESTDPGPTPSQECSSGQGEQDPDCGQAAPPPDDQSQSGGGIPVGKMASAAAIALLVIGVPLMPLLWRTRQRTKRLTPHPGVSEEQRVLGAWSELIDCGWDYGVQPEESATPRKAAARIARIGELNGPEAEAAHRVALAVEGVLYAPQPQPAEEVEQDVRRVRAGLREAAPRGIRLRAILLPPSSIRVSWGLRRRWTALRQRCARALRLPLRPRGAGGAGPTPDAKDPSPTG